MGYSTLLTTTDMLAKHLERTKERPTLEHLTSQHNEAQEHDSGMLIRLTGPRAEITYNLEGDTYGAYESKIDQYCTTSAEDSPGPGDEYD